MLTALNSSSGARLHAPKATSYRIAKPKQGFNALTKKQPRTLSMTKSTASESPYFLPPVQSKDDYDVLYKQSIDEPDEFWGKIAKRFHWEKPFEEKHFSWNFDVSKGPIKVDCFKGGQTNISYNCLERNIEQGMGDKVALIWEPNEPGESVTMTYSELLKHVCQMSNWLKSQNVSQGDAVTIYMPMTLELPIVMLACARIGALHSVVFGGFSAESLAGRIRDCESAVVVTAAGVMRGKKQIKLKEIVDDACALCEKGENGFKVSRVLVLEKPDALPNKDCPMTPDRDLWYHEQVSKQEDTCPPVWLDSEAPLFLLYTSGSTGQPKGVLHTTGGYMVYAATTTQYVFDIKPDDVYWCTADCGWITGHSYLTYGPLLCGTSSLVMEGVPDYPTPSRIWEIVDKHNVSVLYTAPTAIRALMAKGDEWVKKTSRKTLKCLGTVGEPINPEAWRWYHEVVGEKRCPILDTWWQTETGGHMITPLPGAWAEKAGSATLPFFGVAPVLLDGEGKEVDGAAEGVLALKQAWPSTLRSVYKNVERYHDTYFAPYPGYYFSGDGARRDEDGYYWITGRVDDVINVSGHRIGTAEVESALVAVHECSEAAVVGYEHPIKGQGIYAYVTLNEGVEYSEGLRKSLIMAVRKSIGPFAAPDVIHWAPGLPKTRSGKIMRRVLRKIAARAEEELGDTSTLADPSVVEKLIELRGV